MSVERLENNIDSESHKYASAEGRAASPLTQLRPTTNLICLGAVSPPIHYRPPLDSVDYYIQLLRCGPDATGPATALIPFVSKTHAFQGNMPPLANAPMTVCLFQTAGVISPDDTVNTRNYYPTMTITQASPGHLAFRHRLMKPPPNADPTKIPSKIVYKPSQLDGGRLVIVKPGSNPVDGFTTAVTFLWHQVIDGSASAAQPRDLYLQQPF